MSFAGLMAEIFGDEPIKLTHRILDSWIGLDEPAATRALRSPEFARLLDVAVAYLSEHGIHESLLNALATAYFCRADARGDARDRQVADAMMSILYDLGDRGRFGLGDPQLARLRAERVGSAPGAARLRIARNLRLLTELLPAATFDDLAVDSYEAALRSGDLTPAEAAEAQRALDD